MASIFLVEDNAIVAEAIVRVLQERGGHSVVAVANSPEAAQEKLPGANVDLVLVDVSLPRMSGIDLVAKLRGQFPDMPFLMLSGHNASQYVTHSLAAGARGYILKEDFFGIVEGVKEVLGGNIYLSKDLREE